MGVTLISATRGYLALSGESLQRKYQLNGPKSRYFSSKVENLSKRITENRHFWRTAGVLDSLPRQHSKIIEIPIQAIPRFFCLILPKKRLD